MVAMAAVRALVQLEDMAAADQVVTVEEDMAAADQVVTVEEEEADREVLVMVVEYQVDTVDQIHLDTAAAEEEEDHLHLLADLHHHHLHLMYRQDHQLEEGDETRVTNPSSPPRTTLTTPTWGISLAG